MPDPDWERHVREQARKVCSKVGLAILAALVIGFVLDYVNLAGQEGYAEVRNGVALQILVTLAGLLSLRFVPFAQRNPHPVAALFVSLLAVIGARVLGGLGGFDAPTFYVSYLFAAAGLGVPATARWRVAFTLSTVGSFLVALFAFYPEHLSHPLAHIAWIHFGFAVFALVYFGVVMERRAHELFLLRRAEEERAVRLAGEVQSKTKSLSAIVEKAESVRQEERDNIARVLHDDLAQLIASARMGLRNLERELETNPDNVETTTLRSIVGSLERSTRQVVGTLRDERVPFEVQIEDLVSSFQLLETQVVLRLNCAEFEPSLGVGETSLRAIQEGLSNVLKHADATAAWVDVAYDGEELCVTIADNGLGMPRNDAASIDASDNAASENTAPNNTDGYGLRGLRERADAVGGRVKLESRDGGGLRLSLIVPAAPTQAASASTDKGSRVIKAAE